MKVFNFVSICVYLVAVHCQDELLENLNHPFYWGAFKQAHEKHYDDDILETLRYNIFIDNFIKILKHNERFAQGMESYQLGINKYSDMFHSEFLRKMTGYRGVREQDIETQNSARTTENGLLDVFNLADNRYVNRGIGALPKSVNWTASNRVAPVKDQGQCGSCWAFSAVGALESAYAVKNKNLIPLSEQNLVDCTLDSPYDNGGCNGGWMTPCFTYVKNNNGINTEAAYPYKAKTGATCNYDAANKAPIVVKGYKNVISKNETDLMLAVSIQPVSVAIDASKDTFQAYKKGIYNDVSCSSTTLDHAVLLTGYGVENGVPYWIVKNSWGASWGERGYMKIIRGKNRCGIATAASYPIIG